MKTLFFTLIFVLFGVFTTQAQDKTAITIPASLKADTVSKVTYTYKGKTYKQQEFIDLVYTKAAQKDKEYAAMIDFLKAKNETNIVEKIENETFEFIDWNAFNLEAVELAKKVEVTKKKSEAAEKELEAAEKNLEASIKFNASLDTTAIILTPTQQQKTTLTQLSKDIDNKVVGSEKKYVEFVDKYPDLKNDEKVKLMYEKCKAKLGKK